MEHHCLKDDCTQIYVHQKELSAARDRDSLVFLHEKMLSWWTVLVLAWQMNLPASLNHRLLLFLMC